MTLDENDYLIHQLYTASKTPRIKRARIRGWILTTVAFLSMTYLFFENGNDLLGFYFLFASLLSLVLYPFYSRWRYKRHYKRFIADTYKNRFGEECTLEINEDVILTKDRTGEAKINSSEIEEISEIRDFYFLRLRTGGSLIISKVKTDAQELVKLQEGLKVLADKKGIKHNVELNWKWR
jgi:hypothetical protein